jgi:hypothetical protein
MRTVSRVRLFSYHPHARSLFACIRGSLFSRVMCSFASSALFRLFGLLKTVKTDVQLKYIQMALHPSEFVGHF